VRRLLVTANVVPSSPILVTMLMERLSSSETSLLKRVTRRNIPEDAILSILQPDALMKRTEFGATTLCEHRRNSDVSEEHNASVFNVEE
jgi:hypothetical protein